MAIRERKSPGDPIDWDDLKSMKFTRAVSDFVAFDALSGFGVVTTIKFDFFYLFSSAFFFSHPCRSSLRPQDWLQLSMGS